MKLKRLLLIFSAFILLTNCSKDDTVIDDPLKELDPNVITNSLIIESATKKSGDAPAPTATGPTFELLVDQYTAIGKAAIGFNLQFKTDYDFAGLYLQVKGANNYFDIPASSTETLRTMSNNPDKEIQMEVDNFELPIGILEIPDTGEFCVFICVYDNDGNISLVEDFCVRVSNWGGKSQAIGKWKLTKNEEYLNGVLNYTSIYEWGEVVEVQNQGDCNGEFEEEIDITGKSYTFMELNSDGSFSYNYWLEILSSDPDCNQEDFQTAYLGFWSYNPNNNTIATFDFELRNDYLNHPNDPEYIEIIEEGTIHFYGTIETLNATTLIIKDQYNPASLDYWIAYYEKTN